MRSLRTLVIFVAVLASSAVLAEFRTIVRANEVILSELRLPASDNGIVIFRGCGACDQESVNVSEATQYVLNGRVVSLSEFRRSLATVGSREQETAIVMHHLESDLITRISIDL